MGMTKLVINGAPIPDLYVGLAPALDPAAPVVTWETIPGGIDIDTTALLTGGIPTFARAVLAIPCLLVTGETLWEARTRLAATWHGQAIDVGFAEQPGRHLHGRATLTGWDWPNKRDLIRFTLNLDAQPYWWADDPTVITVPAAPAPGTPFALYPTGYTVVPRTTVTGGVITITITGTGEQITLTEGVYDLQSLILVPPATGLDPVPLIGTITGPAGAAATFQWTEGWIA